MNKLLLVGVIIAVVGIIAVVTGELGKSQVITVINPTPTMVPTPTEVPIKSVELDVPYTIQAPSWQGGDERFQDACEEVNSLMAMEWVKHDPAQILDKSGVEKEVLAMEDYEQKNFKSVVDTSAQDTADRIIKGYFNYKNVEVKPVKSSDDIVRELVQGKVVITPMNGQVINNPHYKYPGPMRHMILVRGYDAEKHEFITNDSGMKDGAEYRYPEKVFWGGIRDYPSGDHAPIPGVVKKMIVVSRQMKTGSSPVSGTP